MSIGRLKKVLKLTAIVGAVGGTALVIIRNDWEVSTIGVLRFGRAAYAATRIVLDYKWSLRNIDSDSQYYEQTLSQIHWRSALRLREMCCSNGAGFIKLGQHLGSLAYLLPIEYVTTMKVLHDRAPQCPLKDVYRVIKEDLGKEVKEMFSSFDPEPLGAASLAQVHRATLKDGTVVAVKVQYPKVKRHSFIDIKTMEVLVNLVGWVFPDFQYKWLAEETKKTLPVELDFVQEGHNCERMGRILKQFSFLKVPKIYWPLSTERVLTMEYCEGGKVTDKAYMSEHGIQVNEVTKKIGELYSEMIFVEGFIHCDPHPGNIFVKKTTQGVQIILLDHGLYRELTDEFRINYCKLWQCLLNADLDGIKRYAMKLNSGNLYSLLACMLTARSWNAISLGIDKKVLTKEEDTEIKSQAVNYFPQITQILNNIPRQMLLILKCNDLLRGIEAALHTRADATSFLNMSRCCVRAVARDEMLKCPTMTYRSRMFIRMYWQLFRINVYQLSLWIQSVPLTLLRNIFSFAWLTAAS